MERSVVYQTEHFQVTAEGDTIAVTDGILGPYVPLPVVRFRVWGRGGEIGWVLSICGHRVARPARGFPWLTEERLSIMGAAAAAIEGCDKSERLHAERLAIVADGIAAALAVSEVVKLTERS